MPQFFKSYQNGQPQIREEDYIEQLMEMPIELLARRVVGLER